MLDYPTPRVLIRVSLGLWFDVFTDSVDIHDRARRRNLYGPVLFELSVDLIVQAYTGRVWVTKLNPTKWEGKKEHQRWFQSKKDLEDEFVYGTFDHMIVFRHCGGELPFGKHLQRIVLDDPGIESDDDIDYFSAAYGALSLAVTDAGLGVPIREAPMFAPLHVHERVC